MTALSQNNTEIDSLLNVIASTTNDSVKMVSYSKLRRTTYFSDPKKAQEYTFKYLEYAKKRKDSFHIAIANFYLGNAFITQSNFENALQHYFIASDYFEREKDSSRLSSILNGIGAAYENNGNDSLSLKYFKRSQQISKSLKDYRRSAIALNNISNIYKNRGELDTSVSYLEAAFEDIQKDGNPQYLIPVTINLANAYSDVQQFEKATTLYNDVIVQIDTINDVLTYADALRGLGNSHMAQQHHSAALGYLKKAFHKYSESNFFDERYDMMPELINAYNANGKTDKGLNLFYEYNSIKDSIFTVEKDKNLTEALQKFEVEKKDAQLQLLEVETEKNEQQKRLYFYLFLSGLLIALLLGFFYYKNRKKNHQLAKQKQLLETTLDEKNVLLKEVHHRVKNSFQIVSSLLYLQSENMEDKEAKIAIKEAENRVRSMVLIHQKLYSKDELVGINTEEYFRDLVKDIFESHQFTESPISYHLDVEPVVLDIETTTPIGLILNELIVNTLKHAFPEASRDSALWIDFKHQNDTLVLKVSDNGKGFSGDIKTTSFGIKLMKALSKKLKATLDYSSEPNQGTEALLTIQKFNILS